jgi:hypothetical protein
MTDLIALAEDLRARGISLADKVERATEPGWSEKAYLAIVTVAKRQATVHVNDVVEIFDQMPKHPNAWGAIWSRAKRDGVIAHRGDPPRKCADVRKHRHLSPVYRSLVYRGVHP